MLTTFLDEFMEPMYTQERYGLMRDIILYLEERNHESIQEEMQALAMAPGDVGQADDDGEKSPVDATIKTEEQIRDEFDAYLMELLQNEAQNFGVTFASDALLEDIFEIIKGLYMIDNYEDVATLIQMTLIDTDDVERLALVLASLIQIDADNICMIVDSVSPDLVKGIQKLAYIRADSAYDQMEAEETATYLLRIRAFKEYAQNQGFEHLKIYDFIANTIMGQTLETYIGSGVLNDLIENNNFEKLSMEIFGLALVSSDGSSDPLEAIRQVADQTLSDTIRVTQLNTACIRVNGGYVKYLQEAINRNKAGG